jgi:acid phosphatase type 7
MNVLLLALLLSILRGVLSSPEQIHLAFADEGDSRNMAISWATASTTKSQVKYGLTPSLGEMEEGYGLFYIDTFHEGLQHHHVVLKDLKPDTVYFYQVGDFSSDLHDSVSSIYSFISSPLNLNTTVYPFSFVMFADMGIWNSNSTFAAFSAYMNTPAAQTLRFVLLSGDIAYADDAFLHHVTTFGYEKTYNAFMKEIQSSLVVNNSASGAPFVLPLMVSPGNHEAECHSLIVCRETQYLKLSLHNFSAYNARFRMPSRESGSFNVTPHSPSMWYSFRYGPIWFTAIDTETDYPGSFNDSYIGLGNGGFGDQLSWVKSDLAKAKAAKAAGLVTSTFVSMHRPIYTRDSINSNGEPSGDAKVIQDTFEELFFENNVTVVCVGHTHATEITYPVYNSTVISTSYDKPTAPIHYLAASAGNDEGLSKFSGSIPSWSRFSNAEQFGFTVAHVLSKTQIQLEFISSDGLTKLDVMTINL